jgi:hypothetical protein
MDDCLEKFFKLVAQAFQPVPRKQVSRAQPGKAVPPANTSFSGLTGEPRLMGNCFENCFVRASLPHPNDF